MKDEFKYSLSTEDNDAQELEYEKMLEKDIESNCVYVDKLELNTELTDEDLLLKSKEEIIEYKNSNITKLKAYIASLQQEKEDLIENFKSTTNNLLERIKELEFHQKGFRPETPMITKNFKNKKNGVNPTDFKKQRCPNCCTEIDQKDYFDHSLQCLRKKYHCTICDIVIDSDKKEEHNETFKSPKFIINAIQKDDTSSFIKSLNHGLDPNIEINENKDRVIHLISRKNNLPMMKALFENDSKVDINVINKNNETPLITAIENKSEEIAVYLIKKKANISLRKKGDMSPLMLCCKFGQMDIVKLLITHGADINEKNILGETPLKIAQINNHEDLAMMLLKEFNSNLKFSK